MDSYNSIGNIKSFVVEKNHKYVDVILILCIFTVSFLERKFGQTMVLDLMAPIMPILPRISIRCSLIETHTKIGCKASSRQPPPIFFTNCIEFPSRRSMCYCFPSSFLYCGIHSEDIRMRLDTILVFSFFSASSNNQHLTYYTS